MFHTDDSMEIGDINKVAKRHIVYLWPEKCVFSYTYTWKSWYLVGFEHTLFGRAKVQPHYAYLPIAKTHMVYIWPEKGVFSYTYTWKCWHLVGFEPTLFGRAKVQPHYAYQPIAKTHMVYIWPEKGIFSYTYTWKCWHLMGFEPTLFGRAKVQPQYSYQPIAKTYMVYILPEKMCIFLYLHLKKLAPGGIWTHTFRAGEGATTLRVSAHSKNAYGLYLSLIQEEYWNIHWQILRQDEIWTHTRRITWMCHCFMRIDMFP